MFKNINGDALVVHLTVNQIKEVIGSVFQQSSSSSGNQPEVIDIEEVSKLTGYKQDTIYKLIHERKMPFHKPAHGGRRVFFKLSEIEEWLQSNRTETNEDFFRNYGNSEKGQTNSNAQSQQRLRTFKALYQLFRTILSVINNYKAYIQELEEKVSKYEIDNQMIENLFINDIKTTDDERK